MDKSWDDEILVGVQKEKNNVDIINSLEEILKNDEISIDIDGINNSQKDGMLLGILIGTAFTKKTYTNILNTIIQEGVSSTCTCNDPKCTCGIVGKKSEEELQKEKNIIKKVEHKIKEKEKMYGLNDKKVDFKNIAGMNRQEILETIGKLEELNINIASNNISSNNISDNSDRYNIL